MIQVCVIIWKIIKSSIKLSTDIYGTVFFIVYEVMNKKFIIRLYIHVSSYVLYNLENNTLSVCISTRKFRRNFMLCFPGLKSETSVIQRTIAVNFERKPGSCLCKLPDNRFYGRTRRVESPPLVALFLAQSDEDLCCWSHQLHS